MFNLSELKARRRRLLEMVDKDSAVILISASRSFRNGDVHYPYRQDSDFYYLTAFQEPNAIALLLPDGKEGRFILFNQVDVPLESLWVGSVIGQERACKEYGADEAHPIDKLESLLLNYLATYSHYYCLGGQDFDLLTRIHKLKPSQFPQEGRQSLLQIVHEMRLKKSMTEIDCLRQAATISAQAHIRAMKACSPGGYEYQLEGELLHEFYQQGSRATAYPSIVAVGGNACILHYTENKAILRSGDLVLIDAGCEYQYYASDITRCFPTNGTFNSHQKAIYDIVLRAQQSLINLIKPGLFWGSLQSCCVEIITQGLLDLGLLKGNLSSLIEQKAYKRFYMHHCSHWLGLDVHDVGGYKQNDQWRALEPNMVFTVEPGLYISQTSDIDEKWWNIGIRIEDDIRVTNEGCEVLSSAAPKEIADIESLMCS